jgi:hypothetical protein
MEMQPVSARTGGSISSIAAAIRSVIPSRA